MLRKLGPIVLAAALGCASAAGVAACGEERGSVTVEGGGTTAGGSAATAPTETSRAPDGTDTGGG